MNTVTLVTFILGMILGTSMITVSTYVYYRKQVFPIGAIVMTVFGTLLLGLSIWQSAKIQVGADGNISASFEKFKQEVKEEVKHSNQSVTQKIEDLNSIVGTDSSSLEKLRRREVVDRMVDKGDYEAAIQLDPDNVIAYMRLIEHLVTRGEFKKATSYYQPLLNSNQSGVGYSVFPDLIYAYDQVDAPGQSDSLVRQLKVRVNEDINNGYGYLSRSQQIGWIKDGLQKYISSFKNEGVRLKVAAFVNDLNQLIIKLTQ